jgi:type I restriction enzyme M protein
VLVLQRKDVAELQREAAQGAISDYEVFMAQNRAIGHDKRGVKVFKRNDDGEEIYIDSPDVVELAYTAMGEPTARALPRQKLLDDDTPEISAQFQDWKREAVLGW